MSPAAANGPSSRTTPIPSYFVVMIDFGRKGREAIVDPEVTRREIISRLISRDYDRVLFIQHVVQGSIPRDVTIELQLEASVMAEAA